MNPIKIGPSQGSKQRGANLGAPFDGWPDEGPGQIEQRHGRLQIEQSHGPGEQVGLDGLTMLHQRV